MALYNNTDTAVSLPKYLNRGQIAVVNITNKGSAYTAVPTVAIAAPSSGVQATATAVMELSAIASIAAGGADYVAGDILTLSGGTGTSATLTVTTVSGAGAVTAGTIATRGAYTALPGSLSTAAITGGSGTNATFSVNFRLKSITITNPGQDYVSGDNAAVTFNPASTSAATAIKAPNIFATGGSDRYKSVVFVSREEAQLVANIKKGLNSPGWWTYSTYFDSDGNVRNKCELLASMDVANATSGDTGAFGASDDTIAADVNAVVSISVQPANQLVSGGAATFGVTAAVAPSGSLTYQWQKKVVGGRSVNINGATSSTLVLADQVAADTGTQYRVVVGSNNGAAKLTSAFAALTYTPTYISVQPADVDTDTGGATFTVTAVAPSGTKSYQWQKQLAAGTTWSNVGTDSATLALTGLLAANDGDKVRVIVSNTNLDAAVTSDTAIITFVS